MRSAEAAHVERPQVEPGSPSTIQFAITHPAPPDAAMPEVKPQHR
jgi:hypothetical protein